MKKIVISLVLILLSLNAFSQRSAIPLERLNSLTGEQNEDLKVSWDKRYSKNEYVYGKTPAKFLSNNFHYIPAKSSVLDLGMGEGRNAVFMAQKGYKVTGIDISSVAVRKAQMLAKEFGVQINGVVANLSKYKINDNSFDAIICFYYVDRPLIERMKKWLRPGGIIIYEAFTLDEQKKPDHRSEDSSYFLKNQELLRLFSEMRVLQFEEPTHEFQYRSSIIVQKQ